MNLNYKKRIFTQIMNCKMLIWGIGYILTILLTFVQFCRSLSNFDMGLSKCKFHRIEGVIMDTNETKLPKYLTVAEWIRTHSWPPEGGLRHLIFHAASNGFDRVVLRCGRRVLINEEAFFDWLSSQKNQMSQMKEDIRKIA